MDDDDDDDDCYDVVGKKRKSQYFHFHLALFLNLCERSVRGWVYLSFWPSL